MSESTLTISVEGHKRVDVVTVNGRIDSSNASELDKALENCRDNMVLELSGVNYMSSAGLRALVSARKRGGNVSIATPSERVMEVLQMAGLAPLFKTYDDLTDAVGSY